jgi:hypothetical protein
MNQQATYTCDTYGWLFVYFMNYAYETGFQVSTEKVLSSGMLQHVIWHSFTNILEAHTASLGEKNKSSITLHKTAFLMYIKLYEKTTSVSIVFMFGPV